MGIRKGDCAKVVSIEPMGPDFCHNVRVTLAFRTANKVFYARHPNRLADDIVRLTLGDPTLCIEIAFTPWGQVKLI